MTTSPPDALRGDSGRLARSTRGRNSKARGKAVERIVARLYGGQRMPDTGTHWADVQTATAVIEVKSRQAPTPPLIREAWDQAETAARATGKVPLVVLSYVDGGRRVFWELRRVEAIEATSEELEASA